MYSKNLHYLTNDNISWQNLWKDNIHLINVGNYILAGNFISYMNEFVLTKSNSLWLRELPTQCRDSSTKDIIHQLRETNVDP